jgi:hypothetical protein
VDDPQVAAITDSLKSLIPSLGVTSELNSEPTLLERLPRGTMLDRGAGIWRRSDDVVLWFRLSHGQYSVLTLNRQSIPISSPEKSLLSLFPVTVRSLLVTPGSRSEVQTGRVLSARAFEELLVARYLRGHLSGSFWRYTQFLDLLQRLSFERYEGHQATSGIVFTSSPSEIVRLSAGSHIFFAFETPIEVQGDFFQRPTSHRYVDGRDGFYLVDRLGMAVGVLRSKNPNLHSPIDRSSHRHMVELLGRGASVSVVAAFTGFQGDVNVITQAGRHLRWVQSRWHFFDLDLPLSTLGQFGVPPILGQTLMATAYRLSDQRLGTILLVTNHDAVRPRHIGYIDGSRLGIQLKQELTGIDLGRIVNLGGGESAIASDGLTTISRTGRLIDIGEIVDASHAQGALPGGGRTQAASAASLFGVVVKVSQDGPVSIFHDGVEQLRLLR